MKQRVITGIILIGICLPLILLGGYFFKSLLLVVLSFATYEYVLNVLDKTKKKFFLVVSLLVLQTVLSITFPELNIVLLTFTIIGLFFFNTIDEDLDIEKISYLFFMNRIIYLCLVCLINLVNISSYWLIYLCIVVYGTDAFALIGGKRFGKHKLNQRISPNKTWEGCISGYLFGSIFGVVGGLFLAKSPLIIIPALLVPIFSQIGDLAFSSIKRYFKIKDFSNIFPGHGGMLDRIDSLVFSILIFNLFLGVL